MELSSHNSVAVLAFSPTAGYPRLTAAVLGELDDLLEEVKGAGLYRGVVLAANAKSFATGAEIEEVAAAEGVRAREFAERGQSTCRRIAAFPLPVVAAIRGFCDWTWRWRVMDAWPPTTRRSATPVQLADW
jgi:enoyl-CoA hydratase/carnithine racemase